MPKVSVIIPVFNSEKYLHACLDSVINQTLKELEIIVVDDGSTDSSREILEDYKSRYPDKVYLYFKENGGQGSARNSGIMLSRGEYIGFVDSDDTVEHIMYQTMYEEARKNDLDYIECDYKYIQAMPDGKRKELPKYVQVSANHCQKDMFHNPLVSPWNKLYRGKIIRNSDIRFPEGVIYEDTSFYFKAIPRIRSFGFIEEEFVNHFMWSESTMNSNKSTRVSDIFDVVLDVIEYYINHAFMEKYEDELEYAIVRILLCSSLQRIANVEDKQLRSSQMKQTLQIIHTYFNNFKRNPYFKRGLKNTYMKNINGGTISLYCRLLRIIQAK